jgi:hypothetical protein
LIWLDINPGDQIVRDSIRFLNGGEVESGVSSCVPAALLKSLGEEELDAEERVQRCQADARQYLAVKPEIAWSRAQQAVTLLGRPGSLGAVTDEAARHGAYLTLAEICFTLGFRDARLAPELGRPDLFLEASRAAVGGRRVGLASILDAIGRVHRAAVENRLQALVELADILHRHKDQTEPWLLLELGARSNAWMGELEAALFNGHNAAVLIKLLPPFYETLDVPDRVARTQRIQQRAIQLLIKDKQFGSALAALRAVTERQPRLEAACHEGLGDFRSAAECHLFAGDLKEALSCYRSIPDLEAALKLVAKIGEHPAAESLQWISQLQRLVLERPEKFTKTVTAAEKKMLEELLERALGVSRRKVAQQRSPQRKNPVPRKRAPRKADPDQKPYF